jgi:hypothetical protein
VKIWHLPEDGLVDSVSNPECTVVQGEKRIENIAWNPIAEHVLALSVQQAIRIYDVDRQSAQIGTLVICHCFWSVQCMMILLFKILAYAILNRRCTKISGRL